MLFRYFLKGLLIAALLPLAVAAAGGGRGLTLAVAIGAASYLAYRTAKPFQNIAESAQKLSAGEWGVQMSIARDDPGGLASAFNYLSAQMSASSQETQRLYDQVEKSYLETLVTLANSIDSKDSYTRGHSQRVGDLAAEIGQELKLPRHDVENLRYGGILHDVGKIGVPESILCKPSRLTSEEMQVMRQHPEMGASIVRPVTFLNAIRHAIRNHHERWDGEGYPDKLKGEDIPLIARIINCADTYDACTSTRPYQVAMSAEKTLEILENLRGSQLDPSVLDALTRIVNGKQRSVRQKELAS